MTDVGVPEPERWADPATVLRGQAVDLFRLFTRAQEETGPLRRNALMLADLYEAKCRECARLHAERAFDAALERVAPTGADGTHHFSFRRRYADALGAGDRVAREAPAPKPDASRLRIYVAGPYTQGDVAVNVRRAILAADELLAAGFAPYVPHLSHFWHLVSPHPYEAWLELDVAWLRVCDALLLLAGPSEGAAGEAGEMWALGRPVFTSVLEVKTWVRSRREQRDEVPR